MTVPGTGMAGSAHMGPMTAPEITDAHLEKLRGTLLACANADHAELGREHLLAIVDDLIHHRAMVSPSPHESPEGHADALADTGDAYAQHHGWTLQCLWCDFQAQGRTKREALAVMQAHYDKLPDVYAELR